ncbi:hypothetical protein [Calycomorphotria hydatis]|uniref:Uncharacterized protein n=1 Tax=Calycomorphotria hydatis TaxID=2528027 RepID=A0A517TBK3_9PLAN|nr:hypothetical protein [Calycomorphotria hydatis]QDT65747.1 hypothetical protein V22_30070 [Calycomorphotria hydatis]
MSSRSALFAVLVLFLVTTCIGCGPSRQDLPVGTKKYTQVDNLRLSLERHIELGEIQSETELYPEMIQSLEKAGVSAETISKLQDLSIEMMSAKTPDQLKQKAEEMLKLLPEPGNEQ